jgi:hypothetical protein
VDSRSARLVSGISEAGCVVAGDLATLASTMSQGCARCSVIRLRDREAADWMIHPDDREVQAQ